MNEPDVEKIKLVKRLGRIRGQVEAVEGNLSAVGMSFAVITTRWNTVITDRLLQGSLDALRRSGAAKADIEVVRVPGAWEIPSAARALARSRAGAFCG